MQFGFVYCQSRLLKRIMKADTRL